MECIHHISKRIWSAPCKVVTTSGSKVIWLPRSLCDISPSLKKQELHHADPVPLPALLPPVPLLPLSPKFHRQSPFESWCFFLREEKQRSWWHQGRKCCGTFQKHSGKWKCHNRMSNWNGLHIALHITQVVLSPFCVRLECQHDAETRLSCYGRWHGMLRSRGCAWTTATGVAMAGFFASCFVPCLIQVIPELESTPNTVPTSYILPLRDFWSHAHALVIHVNNSSP